MGTSDFVSVNNILADVLIMVNDETMRNYGFNRGYYISSIQKALEELALQTFFDVQTRDMDFPTTKLAVELPAGAFNIREIYVYDGEICKPTAFRIVHWKRNYNNKGNGSDATAKRLPTTEADFIYPKDSELTGLLYANVQNGVIMFSSGCKDYSFLRIVYNGMAGAIGDEPVIPRIYRQAIVDYVVERCFRALKVKDRTFRTHWADAYQVLTDPKNGTWIKAERRAKSLHTFQGDTLREYLGRMNY